METGINGTGLPSWLATFPAGERDRLWDAYVRGRLDERRDADQRWQAATSERAGLLEPAASITVGGVVVKRWTWRDREQHRQAVIREAHEAGVHGAGARHCRWCAR